MSETQRNLDKLVARLKASREEAVPAAAPYRNGHAALGEVADDVVIEKCRAAENAAKFADLFDHGDVHAHHGGDESAADLALLGMLRFWTQDAEQLERIFSSSALGRRGKWRNRTDYRRRTIARALEGGGETYDWTKERGRYRYHTPIRESNGNSSAQEAPEGSIAFSEVGEPEPLEDILEGVIVRGWPALWFGGTGVTKSVTALATARAIADEHTHVFLGRAVITAPVMYADWELNAQVQGRRAYQIARGRGRIAPPPNMRYMSTYGAARRDRQDFAARVLEECTAHKSEVCFIDSVGLALGGNPGDFEVIIDFFDNLVAEFTANGITPVLIDHQRRLQLGERNQSLGAYGSVWKENLSRTQMQIELVTRDREAHTITTRLRPKKTNFGELPEPIEVKTSFSENTIELERVELSDAERAAEETLSAPDRILSALSAVGEAGPVELGDLCNLKTTTVKKTLSQLRNEDPPRIENTGEFEGRAHKVRIVTVTHPYRGNGNGNGSETAELPTVEELFREPPMWLATQLEKYFEDPERMLAPLLSAVAVVVLEDAGRGPDVRADVEKELERWQS